MMNATTLTVDHQLQTGLIGDALEPDPKMRILLVEDAPFLRYAFARLLRHHGYEVMEANDGRQALECLPRFRPQMIVTDLRMPVMDGVELIQRLRADPETADLPILAITADASDRFENQALQAGAADCLTKPFDLSILLDRLRDFEG